MPEEITWSLMHPTAVDPDYFRAVLRHVPEYEPDSFEICGAFASPLGGLNGLARLEPYPRAAARLDRVAVDAHREKMRVIIDLAHAAGKPIYHWHREIMIPPGLLEDVPELLDEDGEFDLLGEAFFAWLRYKLDNAFATLPGLDGIVLTLTEADYSVIHNSRPDRYPPDKVVGAIAALFAAEHAKRGKRFILRSFGSVARDYEDLLAGAVRAACAYDFDIETKITPYDFTPFLPENPFLRVLPGTRLNAECDGLGEYLGAGYLPAAQVEAIERYVREAKSRGVARYAIRLDRVGNGIFNSANEINLHAYTRFIRAPGTTVADVMREFGARHYPRAEPEMSALARQGFACVTKLQFVAGNVMFHKFPILPDFRWIKAGGIFAVFAENRDLRLQADIWSIAADKKTPGRAAIAKEKREALRLAEDGLERVRALRPRLDEELYARHERAWRYAVLAAKSVGAFVDAVIAYFDDMLERAPEPARLGAAVRAAEAAIVPLMRNPDAPPPTLASPSEGATLPGDDPDRVYLAPLRFLCRELLREYRAEWELRRAIEDRPDVVDYVLPGVITDDARVGRAMHASHVEWTGERPARRIGNPVFPNAVVRIELRGREGGRLEIVLAPGSAPDLTLTVDGREKAVRAREGRIVVAVEPADERLVGLAKRGRDYPAVEAVILADDRDGKGES